MNLDNVKPLNDFPETPYCYQEYSTGFQFRWINGQCFQFKLPDGKILMTDPFFPQHPRAWKMEGTPILPDEDLGCVDYVTINHSHFDHTASLPKLYQTGHPLLICDRIFARELSARYEIPEYNIYPIVTGLSYHFPDFELQTIHGNHGDMNTVSDPAGSAFMEKDSPFSGPLNSYGCLFNTNYMFLLKNGFRIGFAAGTDIETLEDVWKKEKPNLLLRQRFIWAEPEQYADEIKRLGVPMVVPMHQDACSEKNQDMNEYTDKVNKILVESNSGVRMLNLQRMKWYTVGIEVHGEA